MTKKTQILESSVQARIIKRYQEQGYLVLKIGLTNMPGFPDLMLLRQGEVFFIEVKRSGEKPRPLQKYRISQLQKEGFNVLVLDN